MKKTNRPYALKARGEKMAGTRARIVEAIMQLHERVGPGQTTVSAIAVLAGVERLTVYRHFKDEADMLAACSQRHLELNPLPDPSTWLGESDPVRRARRGLTELYAFFGRTAPMFEKTYRDVGVSLAVKNVMARFDARLGELADVLAAAWPDEKGTARRRHILRHATRFSTWQSFEADHVDNARKVGLMIDWLSV